MWCHLSLLGDHGKQVASKEYINVDTNHERPLRIIWKNILLMIDNVHVYRRRHHTRLSCWCSMNSESLNRAGRWCCSLHTEFGHLKIWRKKITNKNVENISRHRKLQFCTVKFRLSRLLWHLGYEYCAVTFRMHDCAVTFRLSKLYCDI